MKAKEAAAVVLNPAPATSFDHKRYVDSVDSHLPRVSALGPHFRFHRSGNFLLGLLSLLPVMVNLSVILEGRVTCF